MSSSANAPSTAAPGAAPWPTEIRLKRETRMLEVVFDDGSHFALPAELLRVESPSAEVRGHGGEEKKIVAGKRDVAIASVEPVGNYAVRLLFDDGHTSGFFTWETLHRLGRDQDAVWADYLARLKDRGLSRES